MRSDDFIKELLKDQKIKKAFLKQEINLAYKISRAIKELRINNGLTQAEFAKKIKTQQPSVARMESGEYVTKNEQLEKIAAAFNCTLIAPKFCNKEMTTEDKIFEISIFPEININKEINYNSINKSAIKIYN